MGPGGDNGRPAGASEVPPSRLSPELAQMLQRPKDEAIQLQGIEALFAQQTQVDAGSVGSAASAPGLQASLEASVAIFSNFPEHHVLLLKASQFLSVLLAEPSAQELLPLAVLFQASKEVVHVASRLIDSHAASRPAAETAVGSAPTFPKLMTWLLSLLEKLLPCLGTRLAEQAQSEPFVQALLGKLVGPLLGAAELPQEALVLKCVQLLPLLPSEA